MKSKIYSLLLSLLMLLFTGDKDIQSKELSTRAQVLKRTPIGLGLSYVKKAEIVDVTLFDLTHKALEIELSKPMSIISTLEGQRETISIVGNCYSPPKSWSVHHKIGLEESKSCLAKALCCEGETASFLFTGANMDNLSVSRQSYKDMAVWALVTAGVTGNAMRMSRDEGLFYEMGTINIILLSNAKLSKRAMTRAIITATEAKTAALSDLDIRSSYSPLKNQATGTGTDNMIIVEGTGPLVDKTGGHTKMGELMSKAVYNGVLEAIYKQNKIKTGRGLLDRLKERKIDIQTFPYPIKEVLLKPRYAGFMESVFAVSDHEEKGIVRDLEGLKLWGKAISEELAENKISGQKDFLHGKEYPPALKIGINAILNGLHHKKTGGN